MATLDAKQAGLPNDGSPASPAAIAAFNRQLRQQSAPTVNFPPGLYALPASLAVPNGVTFTGPGATLQALAPSTPLFQGDAVSGATWDGLTLLGLGSDYQNRNSGGPTNACAVKLTGQGGPNGSIRVTGCQLRNFGWAGILVNTANDLLVEQTTIDGPGSAVIPPQGNNCFGLVVYGVYAKLRVNTCRFSGMATGLLTDHFGADAQVNDCWFTDIPGQHALYFNHANGLTVQRCTFRNVRLDGVKIQHDRLGFLKENGQGVSLIGNLFSGVGGKPIVVANLNDPGTWDFYGLTITDNTMAQLGMLDDGIYLRGCHNAQLARNTILDGQHGIRLSACSAVQITDSLLSRNGQCGIAVGLPVPGGAAQDTTDIEITGNDILHSGQQRKAGYTFGVGLWSGTNLTVQGNTISDRSGCSTAAVKQNPRADGASLRILGNHGFGPGLALAGPIGQEQGNRFEGV